ncbi:MAG: class I SAM-dependent methyltransferase family protein [archaeon]|nr:class I SAM-dependent methyltransferase family protein [archaeon]
MLKEALSAVLDKTEIGLLSSSFDVIGDIAIIKVPNDLSSKESLIASQILRAMKNVRTVLKQSSDVQGEFRLRDLNFVGGEEKYDTIYKESGCLFKINVKEVYFSPRLSTERERIASLVKNGEHILNMFAGISTFSIIIAKTRECEVESVDKNPRAIGFARESLKLNRHLKGKVNPILADATEFARSHKETFDRVIMPLPEQAKEFLEVAFESARDKATIHYYVHVPDKEFQDENWIAGHLKSLNLTKRYEILNWKKVREVGPRYIQAVADLKVYS